MKFERLNRQFSFIGEVDKEKMINRQSYISNGQRKENDAEHAWHTALMAVLLSEYAKEKIDVLKTVTMLLIHDIVEIDAGDTYAYDEEAKKTQSEREKQAADRIYALLPEDQGCYLHALWKEFEEWETPEAKFAHVMDNLQPMMLNAITDGKSWEEHGVIISQILERNKRMAESSNKLWDYAKERWIDVNVQKGRIKNN